MAVDHLDNVQRTLNVLCAYAGALTVAELRSGHVQFWIDSHTTWKSLATRRNVVTIVQAAFNYVQREHGVRNPLKGLKKPPHQPRLHSLSPEEEQAIYQATDEPFRQFLFAAIQTGLRPFCELAQLQAEQVEETPRGMMWRIYSPKTRKTRKIPVRTEVAQLTRFLRERPDTSGFSAAGRPRDSVLTK